MSGTGTARTLAAADWAVIVAFFATMVAIGLVCARRQKSNTPSMKTNFSGSCT